jgi:hypothetical protein
MVTVPRTYLLTEREQAAYHEAGHAVAAAVTGHPLLFAAIWADPQGWQGLVVTPPDLLWLLRSRRVRRQLAERSAVVSAAGVAAVRLYAWHFGTAIQGAEEDLKNLHLCAQDAECSEREQVKAFAGRVVTQATEVVSTHRTAIIRVADELLREGFVMGDRIRKMVADAS